MKELEGELRKLEIITNVLQHNIQALQSCLDVIFKKMAEEEMPPNDLKEILSLPLLLNKRFSP